LAFLHTLAYGTLWTEAKSKRKGRERKGKGRKGRPAPPSPFPICYATGSGEAFEASRTLGDHLSCCTYVFHRCRFVLAFSVAPGLWEDYDNYTPSDPELTNSDVRSLDTELDNYLREPRIPRLANIYAYWYSSQFPGLEPAARKYLSAPPTSVASEQPFSAAGQIYSDRRSNLLGENAEKLLFLSYNTSLFNYDY